MQFHCLPEHLVDFRQRGQSLQQFVKLFLGQLLRFLPEVEYRAADVAELVGALLGCALADILLPQLQPLELVGYLLSLGFILLTLCEELFFCVHHYDHSFPLRSKAPKWMKQAPLTQQVAIS